MLCQPIIHRSISNIHRSSIKHYPGILPILCAYSNISNRKITPTFLNLCFHLCKIIRKQCISMLVLDNVTVRSFDPNGKVITFQHYFTITNQLIQLFNNTFPILYTFQRSKYCKYTRCRVKYVNYIL